MRHSIFSLTTAALVLALAACGGKPQETPTQAFVVKGVSMKLDPPAAPGCNRDTLYRSTLSWSVDGIDAPKTEVRMEKPDGTIFARSNDRNAHAETGDWVRPGMWFLLFNRKSGDMLGALQAGPKPCP